MAQKLKDLEIGAKLKFGSIYGKPLTWLVADKNHDGYPAGSVTLVAAEIVKLLAFDAKEPDNKTGARSDSGNNNYRLSNVRAWLNSAEDDGEWFEKTHKEDAPPVECNVYSNPYDGHYGFLAGFSENEKSALLPAEITVGVPDIDGGGTETVSDKVFLLSGTEVGLTTDYAEGSKLALFTDNASRIANISADAAANSTYAVTAGAAWYWWLRTPYAAGSYSVRVVYTDGTLYSYYACSGRSGLRPACNLSSSLLVSDSPDADGAYRLLLDGEAGVPDVERIVSIPGVIEDLKTLKEESLKCGSHLCWRISIKNADGSLAWEKSDDWVLNRYHVEFDVNIPVDVRPEQLESWARSQRGGEGGLQRDSQLYTEAVLPICGTFKATRVEA